MSDSDGKTFGPLADTAAEAPLVNAKLLQSPGRLEVQLGPAPAARIAALFWAAACGFEVFVVWEFMREARPGTPLLLNLPLIFIPISLGLLLASLVMASLTSRLTLTPGRYELHHRVLGFLNWQHVGATSLIRGWEYPFAGKQPAAMIQGYLFPLRLRKANGTSHYLGLGAAHDDKRWVFGQIRTFLRSPEAAPAKRPDVIQPTAKQTPQVPSARPGSDSLIRRGLLLGGPVGALALMLAGLLKFARLRSAAQSTGQLAADPDYARYLVESLIRNELMFCFGGALLGGLLGSFIARQGLSRARSALLGAWIGAGSAVMVYGISGSMSPDPLLPLGFALYSFVVVVGIAWLVGQAGDDGVP